jgi:hypothetical protein
MTGTRNRAEQVRAHLDATQPDWQSRVRADLDTLTPGWESFPLLVWDELSAEWVEVILLANPETNSRAPVGFLGRVRRWFGRER